jgi:hypothetical protein
MAKIKTEMDEIIKELERKGIEPHSHISKDTKGLGDVVEDVLQTFGITEERFKQWFSLKECNCTKRKKWLNGLFSWKVRNGK